LPIVLYGGSVPMHLQIHGVASRMLLRLVRATVARPQTQRLPSRFRPKLSTGHLNRSTGSLPRSAPTTQGRLAPGIRSGPSIRRRYPHRSSAARYQLDSSWRRPLANNQSLRQLKQLWIEKGDIVQLYNDGKHSKDVNLSLNGLVAPSSLPRRPAGGCTRTSSPLSDGMGPDPEIKKPSRSGSLTSSSRRRTSTVLPVSVRLANGAAVERRHRQVFPLPVWAKEADQLQNDFEAVNTRSLPSPPAARRRCRSSSSP